MNHRIYLVTGAAGHLGNTLIRMLTERGERVRGFDVKRDSAALHGLTAALFFGDLRDADSLSPFFDNPDHDELIVIHTAGIVSIASKFQQAVYDVNVGGTANVIAQCLEHRVHRLIYVSSVHAIPEKPAGEVMGEVARFSPESVHGLYAQTKAEATRLVLESGAQGLSVSVVHPSGILGAGDFGSAHLTQLVVDYLTGRLTAGVAGGYDFVDVRDVALGVLACAERGRAGECYILSNQYYDIGQLLELLHEISGRKKIRTILPLWFARATAPLAERYYALLKRPPLYTAYSLYTLTANARFSHQKATGELGYHPRPMRETLTDMTAWLKAQGRV